MLSFVNQQILKKKDIRSLITRRKIEEKNNNKNQILHYDIETYRDKDDIHTPFIVGYTYNDEYKVLTGENCMIKFIQILLELNRTLKLTKSINSVYIIFISVSFNIIM